jgi:hypothetical protein
LALRSQSTNLIDNASDARIPVAASNITYVFNLMSEHAFSILVITSLLEPVYLSEQPWATLL